MADGTGTQGTDRIFDRETLLDLTVNIIPLGIILFFVVLFLVFRPFGTDPVATVISMGLLVIPFAALAILTYFAGKVITEAERYGESETAEQVAETAIGVGEGAAGDEDGTGDDVQEDHPSTGAGGTAAPAGAGTDRAQRTGSDGGKNETEGAEAETDAAEREEAANDGEAETREE
jgi:hypothetical protein